MDEPTITGYKHNMRENTSNMVGYSNSDKKKYGNNKSFIHEDEKSLSVNNNAWVQGNANMGHTNGSSQDHFVSRLNVRLSPGHVKEVLDNVKNKRPKSAVRQNHMISNRGETRVSQHTNGDTRLSQHTNGDTRVSQRTNGETRLSQHTNGDRGDSQGTNVLSNIYRLVLNHGNIALNHSTVETSDSNIDVETNSTRNQGYSQAYTIVSPGSNMNQNTNNNNKQRGDDINNKTTNGFYSHSPQHSPQIPPSHQPQPPQGLPPHHRHRPPSGPSSAPRSQRSASARAYRTSNGHRRSQTEYANYQEIKELAKVSANFSSDLDSQYEGKYNQYIARSRTKSQSDMEGVMLKPYCENVENHNHDDDKRVLKQRPHSSNPRVSFQKVPTMLLPTARPRGREDFMEYVQELRDGAVIVNDPRSQMLISSQYNPKTITNNPTQNIINTKDTTTKPRPKSAATIITTSISDVAGAHGANAIQSVAISRESHIDSYAETENVIGSTRRRRRRRTTTTRIVIGLAGTGAADVGKHQGPGEEDQGDMGGDGGTCPECLKLMQRFGGNKNQLMDWIATSNIGGGINQRKEFAQLPLGTVSRGNNPHFCNFVRKLRLYMRPSSSRLDTGDHGGYEHQYDSGHGRSSGEEGALESIMEIQARLQMEEMSKRLEEEERETARTGSLHPRAEGDDDDDDDEDDDDEGFAYKCDGKCNGKCHANCDDKCDRRCHGKGDGTCDGKCDGKCHENCDESCDRRCHGKHHYKCNGKCHADCDDTCDGKCHYNHHFKCNGNCHVYAKCRESGNCDGKCHYKRDPDGRRKGRIGRKGRKGPPVITTTQVGGKPGKTHGTARQRKHSKGHKEHQHAEGKQRRHRGGSRCPCSEEAAVAWSDGALASETSATSAFPKGGETTDLSSVTSTATIPAIVTSSQEQSEPDRLVRRPPRTVVKKEKNAWKRVSCLLKKPELKPDKSISFVRIIEPDTPELTPVPSLEVIEPSYEAPPLPSLSAVSRASTSKESRKSCIPNSTIQFFMESETQNVESQESVEPGKFYEFPPSIELAQAAAATTAAGGGEDKPSKKPKMQPWLQGRLALSQQSSRFGLPMDMRELEDMTPQYYLTKHVFITNRRQTLYDKVYMKHKAKAGGLGKKELEKALKDVLVNTITSEDVDKIFDMVQLTTESTVSQKLFSGIAALAERLLFPRFLHDDTENKQDNTKEKIEMADFAGLEWKFHGVNINPEMRHILTVL